MAGSSRLSSSDPSTPFDSRPNSHILRRPLIGLAIVFLFGTSVGLCLQVPIWIPLFLSGFTIWRIVVARTLWGGTAWTLTATMAVGWCGASFSVHPPGKTSLTQILDRPAEALSVVGVIVNDPIYIEPEENSSNHKGQWRFVFQLELVDRTGHSRAAHEIVQCRWQAHPGEVDLRYGQRWTLGGVLRDEVVSHPESLRRYRYSMFVDSDTCMKLSSHVGNPIVAFCLRGRRVCARILRAGLDDKPETAGLLKALMLGYRSDLPLDLEETFEITGTIHIFAISGLHVGVFGSLVIGILRMVGIPRHRWSLLVAPVLIAYIIATGMKPSAVRACVMALAYWAGPTIWRKPDAPSAMGLAAILIIAVRPQELILPGFVLSFSVVGGILTMYPLLERPVRERFQPDPWGGEMDRGRAVFVRLWSLFALSTACWVVSFPLCAHFFSTFSPIALLGNLFVVPGAFLVVLTGCLSLITGFFSIFFAEVFNHANAVLISALLRIVRGMSQIPYGYCYVQPPSWAWVVAWYLLLVGCIMLRRRRLLVTASTLGVGLALWVLSWSVAQSPLASVFASDGALILHVDAGRDHVVVDTGVGFRSNEFIQELRKRGVNRLRYLILTGTDQTRLGGAIDLLNRVPIETLLIAFPSSVTDETLEPILEVCRRLDIAIHWVRAGDTGFLADGTEWEVISVAIGERGGAVLRFARAFQAIMVLVDVNSIGQYGLAQASIEPSATVLLLSSSSGLPSLLPAWQRRTGATRIIAAAKRLRGRVDDYEAWRCEMKAVGVDSVLLSDRDWKVLTSND